MSARLSQLAAMYGATAEDVAQAERALMADGRQTLQPDGSPLPANAPEFSAVDRWTMLELWARAVPDQYTKLLRAPIMPDHPGQVKLPGRQSKYDPRLRRHRHKASGRFVPAP